VSGIRLHVDTWDPSYGSSLAGEGRSLSEARVDTELECTDWVPITPGSVAEARLVRLVDGVRRIDARIWVDDPDNPAPPGLGIAASYAAGVVTCDLALGSAELSMALVERGLFSANALAPLEVRGAVYASYPVGRDDPAELDAALQARLRELEIRVAGTAGDDHDLLIVDGPLRGRSSLEAIRLADSSTKTLPRLASASYKDPRAPQNLLPIGGLERRLRALLGDARLLHRALRLAVSD
jgi:hypothetical protein